MSRKSVRFTWAVSLIAVLGVALVLGFVISLASGEPTLYERNFVWLFWLNFVVALLLLLVLGGAAIRLALRWHSGAFGSRLLFKLSAIFALVGVVPGALIYTVSLQFVTRTVDAWFDTKVDQALVAGLNLGKATLDALANDLEEKTRSAAVRLGDPRAPGVALALERLRDQTGAQDLAIVGSTGAIELAASSRPSLAPDRPGATLMRQARRSGFANVVEGLEDEATPGVGPVPRVRALVLVPASTLSLSEGSERYLLAVQPLPGIVVTNALAVQAAYRDYQQRALARDGLRRMYVGTLTLTVVLAVFGAVLIAVVFGNQLARPLLLLAEGMRQVAAGDLGAKPVYESSDEIGGLTRSFAQMTEQLGEARADVDRSVHQLEGARTRLQTILDNLTAGVIVFDREWRIDSVNPGATRILRAPLSAYQGRRLGDIAGLADFAQTVEQRFELHLSSPDAGERVLWQDAFDLQVGDKGQTLTLLVRGASLPGEQRLMVFDDITEVVSAQRSAAWSEVARRLAHEIKNPLTPIQLSAERLQFKLESKLEPTDQAMLQRSVATIVAQVQAMKQLVNEFRDYARLPGATLKAVDLNALVTEVLALYGDAQEKGHLVAHMEPGLPLIAGDSTQLRQVIHNLVQNALDAAAIWPDALVDVRTECARNDDGQLRAVRLKVEDNGPGFPENVLQRAFEPYVTTKSKGTGLGLAVVKKIADEHGARVRIANLGRGEDGATGAAGAQVSISFSRFADPGTTDAGRETPV